MYEAFVYNKKVYMYYIALYMYGIIDDGPASHHGRITTSGMHYFSSIILLILRLPHLKTSIR